MERKKYLTNVLLFTLSTAFGGLGYGLNESANDSFAKSEYWKDWSEINSHNSDVDKALGLEFQEVSKVLQVRCDADLDECFRLVFYQQVADTSSFMSELEQDEAKKQLQDANDYAKNSTTLFGLRDASIFFAFLSLGRAGFRIFKKKLP